MRLYTALTLATALALAQITPAQSTPAKPAQSTPALSKLAVNTAIVGARPFKNSADLIKHVKGIGPKNHLKLGLDKVFTY